MPIKRAAAIINSASKTVGSAVDAANKATVDFLKSTVIPPNVQAATQPPKTLAEVRKKQGEGWYQADIEE